MQGFYRALSLSLFLEAQGNRKTCVFAALEAEIEIKSLAEDLKKTRSRKKNEERRSRASLHGKVFFKKKGVVGGWEVKNVLLLSGAAEEKQKES